MATSSSDLYPLHAEMGVEKVALAIHTDGLSTAQTAALAEMAADRRDARGGPIVLDVPGRIDASSAARMREAAAQALMAQGVAAADIRSKTYETADATAPLLVSFTRFEAATPQCGVAWDGLTHTSDNNAQPNFGCAVSANMAAQIANPGDIAHPRTEDMPNAARRTTMMTAFGAANRWGRMTDPRARSPKP